MATRLLLGDDRLDRCLDAAVEFNLDVVAAGLLDRLIEANLALVELNTASFEDRIGNILRRNRTEETTVFAGLRRNRKRRL